jgi:hypothetical protein
VPGRCCPHCGKSRWPKGHVGRNLLTAAGVVRLERLYLACPRCDRSTAYPLDDRLGVTGFLSPQAQRLLCLAGASWSFDRAAANLQEFCGLTVCDNVIREACHQHGGLLRPWQREEPAASAAFRVADGDVEFQTDGTMVNSYAGWREMRLSIFAKRRRGKAVTGHEDWQQRKLPAPHVRVIEAGVRNSEQLGPAWRRMAVRLGLRQTADITAIADGARWIWRQLDKHLPGVAGVLDIYHASEQLWAAARQQIGGGHVGGVCVGRRASDDAVTGGGVGVAWGVVRGGVVGGAWLLRASRRSQRLCGSVGVGSVDRQRHGGGSVQAGDRASFEANGCAVEGASGRADGRPLRRPGRRSVGRILG